MLREYINTMSSLERKDLLKYLSTKKKYFKDIYGVSKIGVFGSFARDEQKISSDIDIIVEFEKGRKNIHNFLNLKRYLEAELGRNIDLGIEHSLKPLIKEKIRGQIYYA